MIHFHHTTEIANGRFANANVENYFKIVQHRLIKTGSRRKVGRVIKVHHETVKDSLNNVRIDIAEYNKGGQGKKENSAILNNQNIPPSYTVKKSMKMMMKPILDFGFTGKSDRHSKC